MYLMSDALKKLTFSGLKSFLQTMTWNRVGGTVAGIGITGLIQSSSATAYILIGFLNAGLLTFAEAFPVILGATIGTTVTPQIIALRLDYLAPIILPLGLILVMMNQKNIIRNTGRALVGFAILFIGIAMIDNSLSPLAGNPVFSQWFVAFSQNHLLAILSGIVITAILQSSGTSVGIVITLSFSGLLDFTSAFYLILGANIGTCITDVIAGMVGGLSAKRLAVGYLTFKVISVAIAYAMFPVYASLAPLISSDIGSQIANTHTLFNVFSVILMLPFLTPFEKLIQRFIKGKEGRAKERDHLDRSLLAMPALALTAVRRQIGENVDIAMDMLVSGRKCLHRFIRSEFEKVLIYEELSDKLRQQTAYYMVELSGHEVDEKTASVIPSYIQAVVTAERLADIAKKIAMISEHKYEEDIDLSRNSYADLEKLFKKTATVLLLLRNFLRSDITKGAKNILKQCDDLMALTSALRLVNLNRLQEKKDNHSAGLLSIDFLNNFERIAEYSRAIVSGLKSL